MDGIKNLAGNLFMKSALTCGNHRTAAAIGSAAVNNKEGFAA
jgi:hypothetical protein